jgi:hypothetical protein
MHLATPQGTLALVGRYQPVIFLPATSLNAMCGTQDVLPSTDLLLERLMNPDWASTPGPAREHSQHGDPAKRFLLELHADPPHLIVRDVETKRVLFEIDNETGKQIAGLDPDPGHHGSDSLLEAMRSANRSLNKLPAGAQLRSATQAVRKSVDTAPGLKSSRRKLWELPHKLHCPVIGTCLDFAQLQKLAQKAGYKWDAPISEYDLHVSFVGNAEEKNNLSVATHKALDKKYAGHVRRFAKAKTREQLGALWKQCVARGELPGAFWATVTHPRCDADLHTTAYEEVHMLSHQIGAGQRADLKRLTDSETELAALKRDYDALYLRTQQQLVDRERRIHGLETTNLEQADEHRRQSALIEELRKELDALKEKGTHEHISLMEQESKRQERELQLARQQSDHWQQVWQTAERRLAQLKSENEEKNAECAALERLLTQYDTSCDDCDTENCRQCPDLRGRIVLCVGGRNQLINHYRSLVSQCNGRFEHHDGGLEDNVQRLEAKLSSADAVVCAVDCVSHDAYYRLKRFCKRNRKTHVFLRSSGISSFARALENVAG